MLTGFKLTKFHFQFCLIQDLTVASVQGVIEKIDRIADENINENQIKVFHESIKEVLRFGRKERLSEKSFEQMYQVFCKVRNKKFCTFICFNVLSLLFWLLDVLIFLNSVLLVFRFLNSLMN